MFSWLKNHDRYWIAHGITTHIVQQVDLNYSMLADNVTGRGAPVMCLWQEPSNVAALFFLIQVPSQYDWNTVKEALSRNNSKQTNKQTNSMEKDRNTE